MPAALVVSGWHCPYQSTETVRFLHRRCEESSLIVICTGHVENFDELRSGLPSEFTVMVMSILPRLSSSLFAIQIPICNVIFDNWVRTIRNSLQRFLERSGNFWWQYWSRLLLHRKADEKITLSSKGFSNVLLTALHTGHFQLFPLNVPFAFTEETRAVWAVKMNQSCSAKSPRTFWTKTLCPDDPF